MYRDERPPGRAAPPDKNPGDTTTQHNTPAPTKKPSSVHSTARQRREAHIATCRWCQGMPPERPRGSRGTELVAGFARRYEAAKRLRGGDPERWWWR